MFFLIGDFTIILILKKSTNENQQKFSKSMHKAGKVTHKNNNNIEVEFVPILHVKLLMMGQFLRQNWNVEKGNGSSIKRG